MTTLVLELRAGELMVVNGTALRFRSRAKVELVSRARFLFGKQVMAPEEASTPARRIYFALQTAYVGPDELREDAMAELHRLVGEFQDATTSALARQLLDRALALAEAEDWYAALKNVRIVMRHEAAVLGLEMPAAIPVENPAAGLPAVHARQP
jgi:flagellar protein FlbT